MKTIAAAKFKEKCLALLDSVDEEGLIITKHGRPVARLTALPSTNSDADLIGELRGEVGIRGNILSTGIRWRAES